ncbi:MAG: hypothetical protein ABII72_02325, partial [Parcubacteria group bacterium]
EKKGNVPRPFSEAEKPRKHDDLWKNLVNNVSSGKKPPGLPSSSVTSGGEAVSDTSDNREIEPIKAEESIEDLQTRFSGAITATKQLLREAIQVGWINDEAEAAQIIRALEQGDVAGMHNKIAEVEERLNKDSQAAFDSFSNMADNAFNLHRTLTKRGASVDPTFKEFKAGRGPSPEVTGKERAAEIIKENPMYGDQFWQLDQILEAANKDNWLVDPENAVIYNSILEGNYPESLRAISSAKGKIDEGRSAELHVIRELVLSLEKSPIGQAGYELFKNLNQGKLKKWLGGQHSKTEIMGYLATSDYEKIGEVLDKLSNNGKAVGFVRESREAISQLCQLEIADSEVVLEGLFDDITAENFISQEERDDLMRFYRAGDYNDVKEFLTSQIDSYAGTGEKKNEMKGYIDEIDENLKHVEYRQKFLIKTA